MFAAHFQSLSRIELWYQSMVMHTIFGLVSWIHINFVWINVFYSWRWWRKILLKLITWDLAKLFFKLFLWHTRKSFFTFSRTRKDFFIFYFASLIDILFTPVELTPRTFILTSWILWTEYFFHCKIFTEKLDAVSILEQNVFSRGKWAFKRVSWERNFYLSCRDGNFSHDTLPNQPLALVIHRKRNVMWMRIHRKKYENFLMTRVLKIVTNVL